jgi:hypothetical protein
LTFCACAFLIKKKAIIVDFFNPSLLPEEALLLPGNCPPLDRLSDALFTKEGTHIVSFDKKLQCDSDELWRFFMVWLF